MIPLSDQQLEDLQDAIAWETAMRLSDGRVLGRPGKRGTISEPGDFRVRALESKLGLADKRVLELGCHEGIHTVQLASVAGEVVGVEVRPKNVVGALTRLFVHDVRNARIVLGDVRDLEASFGTFDVLFHVGVLYHLLDPVEHLYRVAPMADAILLDTHYETPETARSVPTLRMKGVATPPTSSAREAGETASPASRAAHAGSTARRCWRWSATSASLGSKCSTTDASETELA